MDTKHSLEVELQTYRRTLPELKNQEGKFVLIHRNDVSGVFETYNDALSIGYDKFGLKPFLVKKIAAVEVAQYISRHMVSCPA